MEEQIQFFANTKEWKVVKKLKINEKVPDLDIVDFLASISISFDTNIEKYLRKIVDFTSVDKYLNELVQGKTKKEEELAKILKGLVSPNAAKAINKAIPQDLEKKDKEKLKVYLKIILTKNALKKAGLEIDYTHVPIPINKGKL